MKRVLLLAILAAITVLSCGLAAYFAALPL